MFCKTFINLFIGVLTAWAVIFLVIDVLLVSSEEKEWTGVIVITSMVLLSAVLRFWQEWKSDRASAVLSGLVKNTAFIIRQDFSFGKELEISELVPRNIVHLSAGDRVPVDVLIVESKDLLASLHLQESRMPWRNGRF